MSRPSCPDCGRKLVKMSEFSTDWYCSKCKIYFDENYVDVDDDDTEDGVPRGCAACGGPYPHCKISCNLFDD